MGGAQHDVDREGKHRRERQRQPSERPRERLATFGDWICKLNEAAGSIVRERDHPPPSDVGESHAKRHFGKFRRSVRGMHEQAPGGIAHLIDDALVNGRLALRNLRLPDHRCGNENVVGVFDHRHQYRGALLQLVIRLLVDQPLQHESAADDSGEPQHRQSEHQAACQRARDRSGVSHRHRADSAARALAHR
jgi:hypothetical protein